MSRREADKGGPLSPLPRASSLVWPQECALGDCVLHCYRDPPRQDRCTMRNYTSSQGPLPPNKRLHAPAITTQSKGGRAHDHKRSAIHQHGRALVKRPHPRNSLRLMVKNILNQRLISDTQHRSFGGKLV